jgi:uncharacterized protein YaaW (UPF0174 family)
LDELRAALELATEEELQQITDVLFCRRFNPLDYWQTPEPLDIQSQDWHSWLDSLEQRFRYLAADGLTVLQGKTQEVSYRQILIQVCRYLKIPYSQQMKTTDIEAEVFLHLVGQACQRLPAKERNSLKTKVVNSLNQSNLPEPLPVQLQNDPFKIFLKGSSIVAIGSLIKPWLLKYIARQFAFHFASYQAAKTALIKGGAAAAASIQNQLILQTAKRGMTATAARYGAVRTVFSLIGPVMWGCLIADLGWKAIATNYGRIIPIIFTLAQIRLTRGESWAVAY